MHLRLVISVLVAAALSAALPSSHLAASRRGSVVVKRSSFGRILFDGRGFVLYGFTRDRGGTSSCSSACARAWPPFIVKSRPKAGIGVSNTRLGTIRRRNGSLQATYAGRPLYYYVGDRRPGQILCQNVAEFGGIWRVIRPSGRLVR